MAHSGDWDSLDPGDTYYGYSWNFIRLYGRALTMFKPAPGTRASKLVARPGRGPRRAQRRRARPGRTSCAPASSSRTARRSRPRTSSTPSSALAGQGHASPTARPTSTTSSTCRATPARTRTRPGQARPQGDRDAGRPDDRLPPEAAVRAASTTSRMLPADGAGAAGQGHRREVQGARRSRPARTCSRPTSSARASRWCATRTGTRRPTRTARRCRTGSRSRSNVNADDIDNRLLAGDLDVDIAGTGVQPATQGRVLGRPEPEEERRPARRPRIWYTSINADVAPLDNIDCRKASSTRPTTPATRPPTAARAGGDIATSLLPPLIPGYQKFDLYTSAEADNGDVAKAKEALQACGQPNGFATNISYRAERPKEKATAEALQQSLARVGIKLTLKPYPHGRLLQAVRRQARLRQEEQPRPDGQRLGRGLAGRLRLPVADRRQPRHPAPAGNTNLGVKIPEVDELLDQALAETDATEARRDLGRRSTSRSWRTRTSCRASGRKALLYRPPTLTNVFVNEAFGMYDYLALGVEVARSRQNLRRSPKAGEGSAVAGADDRPAGHRQPTRGHIHHPAVLIGRHAAVHRQHGDVRDLLPGAAAGRGVLGRPRSPVRRAGPPTQEQIHATAERLGFTDPLPVQYGRFVKGIFVGADYNYGPAIEHCPAPCFGYSFINQTRSGRTCSTGCRSPRRWPSAPPFIWLLGGVVDRRALGAAPRQRLRPGRDGRRAGRRVAADLLHRPAARWRSSATSSD